MSEQVCFVVHSMSPHIQQAYWRSVGDLFEVTPRHLVWREHRMSEFGNCQRCGWRPNGKDRVRSHTEQISEKVKAFFNFETSDLSPECNCHQEFRTHICFVHEGPAFVDKVFRTPAGSIPRKEGLSLDLEEYQ